VNLLVTLTTERDEVLRLIGSVHPFGDDVVTLKFGGTELPALLAAVTTLVAV